MLCNTTITEVLFRNLRNYWNWNGKYSASETN